VSRGPPPLPGCATTPRIVVGEVGEVVNDELLRYRFEARLSRKSAVAAVAENDVLGGEFSAGAAGRGRRRRLRRPLRRVGGA
jgi:hypothetical protein